MVKKAILFDLDNTLYEYEPAHKKALRKVYRVLNKAINISSKKFMRLYNLSRLEIHQELSGTASSHNRTLYFQRLVEKTHNTVESKLILKLSDAYWNTFLKNMKLKKGVLSTLKELKRTGFKIVIISDLTTKIQLKKLLVLKINDYIDFLATSEEAGSEKPHSIMFLLALNKIKCLPNESVMVGDNKKADISGANALGIDTILISKQKGNFKKELEDYSKPNYLIKEIPELLKIIKDLQKK